MTAVTVTPTQVRPMSDAMTRPYTAGEAMTIGDVVQVVSDGDVEMANATTAAGANGTIGIVVAGGKNNSAGTIASGETVTVVIHGQVYLGDSTDMDETKVVYIDTSDGNMVDVAPANSRAVGYPATNKILMVNPVSTPAGSLA